MLCRAYRRVLRFARNEAPRPRSLSRLGPRRSQSSFCDAGIAPARPRRTRAMSQTERAVRVRAGRESDRQRRSALAPPFVAECSHGAGDRCDRDVANLIVGPEAARRAKQSRLAARLGLLSLGGGRRPLPAGPTLGSQLERGLAGGRTATTRGHWHAPRHQSVRHRRPEPVLGQEMLRRIGSKGPEAATCHVPAFGAAARRRQAALR